MKNIRVFLKTMRFEFSGAIVLVVKVSQKSVKKSVLRTKKCKNRKNQSLTRKTMRFENSSNVFDFTGRFWSNFEIFTDFWDSRGGPFLGSPPGTRKSSRGVPPGDS